ncbi:MAG TPA: FlgD immunoglobulin-like domain containing protein [Candidatus Eisenbacteria bacterium]|nr:FlgD immunoglobulin-like domain containing protein [Candidatus Eisenbacteria bacterium]
MRRVRGQWIASLVSIPLLFMSPALAHAQWATDGTVVCDSAGTQSGPTVVADGTGGTIVAWQDDRSDTLIDIFVQRLSNAGARLWQAGGVSLRASVSGSYALSPKSMIADGNGGFIIAWIDARAEPSSVIHVQRITLAGQVDPQWPAGGVALVDSGYGAGAPSVVSDDAGGAIVVWEDARDTSTGIAEDIYAQRVNGSGVPQWRTNGVPLCKRYGLQLAAQAVSDGAGGAWATWDDDEQRIVVQHVSAAGVAQFDSTGLVLCDSLAAYRYGTQIGPDGSGGMVVTWDDARSGNENIYAQRVDVTGAVQWAANGIVVCSDPARQEWPSITLGGASDYVIAWVDLRAADPGDVYAQKVTSAGATSWAANGVRVGRKAGDTTAWSASDGLGGAYVCWDNLGGGICFVSDVAKAYAQHVLSSGAIAAGWVADGTSMTSSGVLGPHYSPVVANDGGSSCVVVWHDARNMTDCNVYAQRFGAGGQAVSVDGLASGRGIALAAPEPNPTRGAARFDFRLAQAGVVRLQIVSPSGRLVRELASGAFTAGPHSLEWDGLDANGARVGAGFYLARLESGGEHVSKPVVFLP